MKKIHILAFIMLAVGVFVLITASKDVSTYSNYEDAVKGQRVRIAGELARDRDMIYDPAKNAEEFIFYMTDANGVTKKVVLDQAKPQEFERSETVVVTGYLDKQDVFYADDILVKCPSKYKNEEVFVKEEM